MAEKILVINPGSTSTKIAVYDGEKQVWKESIDHSPEELQKYPSVFDQKDMRKQLILDAVEKHGDTIDSFSAFVSRGGCLPPVHAGAYEVTEDMVDTLHYHPVDQHASNVGAPIAYELAQQAGKKAYIYDALTVDEMSEVNKITGLKGVRRPARGHNLNTRAAALKYCKEHNRKFQDTNIISVQLGGGITMNMFTGGKALDMIMDEEGPFSPERAGGLPTYAVVKMCYSGEYTQKEMMKHLQRSGGLLSLLGTADAREVQKRIDEGDQYAVLVYEAMAKAVAKNIAKLAASNAGKIDVIILTGGIAYSKPFTGLVSKYAGWIAPIAIIPGENEMDALAHGTLRVLRGEEEAEAYHR